MELEEQKKAFEKRGLQVAALSYDSVEVLRDFAARRKITYPLLSDAGSTIIRRLRLLNPDYPEGTIAHGVPYPGTLIVDEHGIVREKYFEEKYSNRRTATSILGQWGEQRDSGPGFTAPHLVVHASPTAATAFPGSRVSLVVEVDLEKGMHAYAPGAEGYRPLRLRLEPDPHLTVHEPTSPASHPYEFKPLHQTVPVFEGHVRIVQDVTVAGEKDLAEVLATSERTLAVRGVLDYQVCSATVCFPPGSLPVSWTLNLAPLDRERVPEPLRRRLRSSGAVGGARAY